MGTKALKVLKNEGGRVLFEALEQIYPQDVFEIDKENSFSSGSAYAKGSRFTVNLPKKYRLEKGRVLYRMKNGELTRFVEKQYVGPVSYTHLDVYKRQICTSVAPYARKIRFSKIHPIESSVAGARVINIS